MVSVQVAVSVGKQRVTQEQLNKQAHKAINWWRSENDNSTKMKKKL
jgi:hypothetical protein